MALIKGTNSYVTASECDSFFNDRIGSAAWTAATSQNKDKALITATSLLDEMSWLGVAISDSQPLSFPRVVEYFEPKQGAVIYLDGGSVPQRVENATCLLASHLLENDDLLSETGSVNAVEIGHIKLDSVRRPARIPAVVKDQIKPLLGSTGRTWWRAM